MMRWISITAIGSTPANGSSSRMKRGCVASARAISTRRRSPPDSAGAGESRRCVEAQVVEQAVEALVDLGGLQRLAVLVVLQFQHGADVLVDRQLAEDRRFLRQVAQAQRARWWIGLAEIGWPSMRMSPASARTRPTIM
jgi:hypothetical protein